MKSPKLKWFAVVIAITLAALAAFVGAAPEPKVWARYPEPSGALAVVIYKLPLRFAMPGSAGDASANIQLEGAKGGIFERTKVESLQLVTEPEWENDRVHMKLVFDWQLPQKPRSP